MTHKYIGEVKVEILDSNVKAIMPSDASIPPKQEWSKHSLWEFNGKAYRPITQKAEDNLAAVVAEVEKAGFTKATKFGKRKPTSVRYAILTTGVEPFYFVK